MTKTINIEIDDKKIAAKPGEVLIEVADRAGSYIPRFCYHKKLSIAANCRMCLVEVENAPKTLPACATPVADGMKVFTRSKATLKSQKAVMEFLLVNHPLDCPVCDQGGECELQDLSLGFGADTSDFADHKRVVDDEDLGSLVATEMTRCIHCTRCVRFCDEIAGKQQLGAFGRGKDMSIGTFLTQGLQSELSGNVIDLCPVGALTSKPFRFSGRSWEFKQHLGIAPHDSVGSNIYMHTQDKNYTEGSCLMRVLPKENENINETWISDRDRFSYSGVYAQDRLDKPLLKRNGKWVKVSWQSALTYLADTLMSIKKSNKSEDLGVLAHPSSTTEEFFMLQAIARHLGSDNIDHRITTACFNDQDSFGLYPQLNVDLACIVDAKAILLVGSFARAEQPMLCHKLRMASKNGTKIFVLNSYNYDFACDLSSNVVVPSGAMASSLAALADIMASKGDVEAIAEIKDLGAQLKSCADGLAVIAGEQIESHIDGSAIRALLATIAAKGSFSQITRGANSQGAWLSGAIPHRAAFYHKVKNKGLDATTMLANKLACYILHGLEPESDCIDPAGALTSLAEADFVVVCNPFVTETMKNYANLILPIATFAETAGSYINCEGKQQQFKAAIAPQAEAKPAWKVYRVLAELLEVPNMGFENCQEITAHITKNMPQPVPQNWNIKASSSIKASSGSYRIGHWPAMCIDPLVRRSGALQATLDSDVAYAKINSRFAKTKNIDLGQKITLEQGDYRAKYICIYDDNIAGEDIWLATGMPRGNNLSYASGTIKIIDEGNY
jgi:NADH-quinone oxidoreductase subunit G